MEGLKGGLAFRGWMRKVRPCWFVRTIVFAFVLQWVLGCSGDEGGWFLLGGCFGDCAIIVRDCTVSKGSC